MHSLDLFTVLAKLKMKGLIYNKMKKTADDEHFNIDWKARRGLLSH
jgi:hypothetical protein